MLQEFIHGRSQQVVALLVLASLLVWALALPALLGSAQAAQITSVSDTLSDSDVSVDANHTIVFTTVTAIAGDETIRVTFDPDAQAFDLTGLVNGDLTISGGSITQVANAVSCGGGDPEVYPSTIDTTNDFIEFTVCTGDTVAGASTLTIDVGATNFVNNPGSVDSYVIRIHGTMTDSGDTRVAILDDVTVTAAVDTSFTFTVTGVAQGQTINDDAGTTTATTTTSTSIPFGTLIVGGEYLAAQTLSVTTNALNGFVVTVSADQDLQSSNGADINSFIDGAGTAAPAAWQAPAGTLGSTDTYGHWGITSEDDLNTDEFGSGTANYAGNFIQNARQVFEHNGPSDGSTANIGQTRVGYKIQIDDLQEAGNDYTATLTYVATPTF